MQSLGTWKGASFTLGVGSLWAHKTLLLCSFHPGHFLDLRNTYLGSGRAHFPESSSISHLARSLFSSELKTKQKTQNLCSIESKGTVCLVSSGVIQQDQEAGDGRICLWGLPEAFSITVLSVIMVITFAARCWGSAVAPFSMFGGGTFPMFTYTLCYSPAPTSPL